jgi:DNA-binding CsgD family transcriptional regulator
MHLKINKLLLALAIIGAICICYSLIQQKDRISSFNTKQAEIIVIDLKDHNEINYLLILGMFLLIPSLVIFMVRYFGVSNTKINDKTSLTQKESEVLILIERGYSNKDISNELSISVSTVKTHVNNIFKKKKVTKRVELIQNCS